MPHLFLMTPTLLTFLITIPFLILLGSFAASSETSIFSLDRFQLKKMKDRHKKTYENIRTLLEHPTRLLIIIIILNEVANLSISNLSTRLAEDHVNSFLKLFNLSNNADRTLAVVTILSLAISTPITLFFAEITPKIIAARLNRFIAAINSQVLIVIYRFFYPVLWLLDSIISFTLRSLGAKGKSHLAKFINPLDEQDFVAILEEAHKEGSLEPAEKRLIQRVFRLDDVICAQAMTPIGKSFVLSEASLVRECIQSIKDEKYSRIPVYAGNRKNIVGILYVKDLLDLRNDPEKLAMPVKSLIAKPMIVTPQTNLSALFRRFKKTKVHMAVVTDRAGQAVGIITLEDVLEAIFGEIEDEMDMRG